MEISRQEYWNGLPFLSPGDLPDPEIKPRSPALQADSLPAEPPGEFVAQFKFTVLLMPNGPMRITSGPFEPDLYKSEMEVQDAELKVSM